MCIPNTVWVSVPIHIPILAHKVPFPALCTCMGISFLIGYRQKKDCSHTVFPGQDVPTGNVVKPKAFLGNYMAILGRHSFLYCHSGYISVLCVCVRVYCLDDLQYPGTLIHTMSINLLQVHEDNTFIHPSKYLSHLPIVITKP